MNRLDKTEHGLRKLKSSIGELWAVLIVLFIVGAYGYIQLNSRLSRMEGTNQPVQPQMLPALPASN